MSQVDRGFVERMRFEVKKFCCKLDPTPTPPIYTYISDPGVQSC